MPSIAFVGTFAARLQPRICELIGPSAEIVVLDEAGAAAHLHDVDVVVTLVFTREMGGTAKRLRLVQVPGAGLDRIDRSALPDGAALANAYGHETGISEYVLGAMLSLTRDFARVDTALRDGRWESQWAVGTPSPPLWPELAGRTVGILGYGRIGQSVARRARAFDMRILAVRQDVPRSSGEGLELLGDLRVLETLLARADYLVITLPLTPSTRGLIGEPQLRLMKPTARLINVARAEIVDEDALYAALAEGRLAGAALDVWYRYPKSPGPLAPAHRPFHELPNVLMTPHVSGWTDGMLEARAQVIAENIGRVLRGDPPLNQITTGA
jgi:phosphoglycerate dehydrogenase-like enzyme